MISTAIVMGLGAGLAGTNLGREINASYVGGGGAAISETDVCFIWSNERLMAAMKRIEVRSAGKRLTPGQDTVRIIREGRAGGMYGIASGS